MENFLILKNISINLKNFYLKNVSFSLEKGDYLSIIGPTGSGKTILLESILGIYPLESGKIFLNNKDISNFPLEKRKIGIIYQDFALFPHFTVYKNIEYGLKSKNKDKIFETSKLLNIEHLLTRMPETLSGGEKQRVAMARALIAKPEIILMDEPFSALDNVTKSLIRKFIKKIKEKFNITIIHVTHDLDDVWSLANKVAVIRSGELLQFGKINEVMYKPADNFVASFVDTNILDGCVSKNINNLTVVNVNGTKILSSDFAKKNEKVKVAFRPEDIIVFKNKPENLSARNILKGKLIDYYVENKIFHIIVEFGKFQIKAILTKKGFDDLGLNLGDEIYLVVKATKVKIV
jgi:molybdate transport system ATP-binding protein